MPYDIFSVRTKQEADPYLYDDMPEGLRNTIFHILRNVMEDMDPRGVIGDWGKLWRDCCQEKGLPLHGENHYKCRKFFYEHLMRIEKVQDVLDMVDIAFQFMKDRYFHYHQNRQKYHEAIDNLNIYFQRASIGYQFVENRIIRIDSEYHHSEAVLPALVVLRGAEFESANKEFLSAHKHYLNDEYGDCITNASSAFETVIKTICDGKEWNYGSRVGKDLVLFLLDKDEFIPKYLRSHFEQLIPTLWSGLFVTRNNQPPGHGQGKKATETFSYMAGYALHLAATNILLLVQIYESQKQSSKLPERNNA